MRSTSVTSQVSSAAGRGPASPVALPASSALVASLASVTFGSSKGLTPRHGARHGGGHLPAEELPPERGQAVDGDADDRLSRAFERRDGGILRGVPVAEANVDEEPIGAVGLGRPDRLQVDRDDSLAVLARRLGHELLDPGAERGDGRAS